MRTMRTMLAAAAFAALGGCGSGAGQDFHRELARRSLELPVTVTMKDFRAACEQSSVTDPDELLASIKVEVHGKEDGAVLYTADLLRACGPECSPGDGQFGSLLATFAVDIHRR